MTETGDIFENVRVKLGLSRAELESLYTVCPVDGFVGEGVAEDLCDRFGLDPMEPLGRQLWDKDVLTEEEARWFDDAE